MCKSYAVFLCGHMAFGRGLTMHGALVVLIAAFGIPGR